jgi:hypothetical protein
MKNRRVVSESESLYFKKYVVEDEAGKQTTVDYNKSKDRYICGCYGRFYNKGEQDCGHIQTVKEYLEAKTEVNL